MYIQKRKQKYIKVSMQYILSQYSALLHIYLFIYRQSHIYSRIASALVMDQFAWSREEAIRYLGIAMATGGVAAGLVFMTVIPLTKKYDNRIVLLVFGLIPFLVGKLVILPMGTNKPIIANVTNINGNYHKHKSRRILMSLRYFLYIRSIYMTHSF